MHIENYEPVDYTDDLDYENDSNSSAAKNIDINYIASQNSDKFHEPSCSQAKRIKEGNEITFSNRQEAIDSGYTPCGICYP